MDQILQSDRLFVLDEVRRLPDEPLSVQDKLVRFAYKMLLQHIVIKPYQPKRFEWTLKDERCWFKREIDDLCYSGRSLIPMFKQFVRYSDYGDDHWEAAQPIFDAESDVKQRVEKKYYLHRLRIDVAMGGIYKKAIFLLAK